MDDNVKNTDGNSSANKQRKNNYNRNRKRNYNKNYSKSNKPENGGNSENSRVQHTSEKSDAPVNNNRNNNRTRNNSGISRTKGYYMSKPSSDENFDELFGDIFGKDSAVEQSRRNDDFSDFVIEENYVPSNEDTAFLEEEDLTRSEEDLSVFDEAEEKSVVNNPKTSGDRPKKKKKKPAPKSEEIPTEAAEVDEVGSFDYSFSSFAEEEEQPEAEKIKSDRPKKKRKRKPAPKREEIPTEAAEVEEVGLFDVSLPSFEEEEEQPEAEKTESDRPKKKKKKKPVPKREEIPTEAAEFIQPIESLEKHGKSTSSKHDKNTAKQEEHVKEEKGFNENRKKSEARFWSRMFSLMLIVPVYAALVICMLALPRSTVSNIEKRNLDTFPKFSWSDYWSGTYTASIAHYFDDTVPFRDTLKQAGSQLSKLLGIKYNDVQITGQMQVVSDTVTVNPDTVKDESKNSSGTSSSKKVSSSDSDKESDSDREETKPKGQEIADGVYVNGVIVVYQDGHYRGMSMYGGGSGDVYADSLNKFAEDLPGVKVYSMIDPTSSEFYTPQNFSSYNASQSDDIDSINAKLQNVKGINICSTLARHTDETIYTRTDHHWMSLGAYYAAQEFAKEAGVPFKDINQYSKKKTPGYVGTMYAFSENNPDLLNDPEDFIYYLPKTKDYTVEYYDNSYNFVMEGDLMVEVADVSDMYTAYIGGDNYIVKISTGVRNGRKLCLVKDSYGNAIPPFLTGSFEEIYVIDMRYLELNLVDFAKDKGITDLLFSCCSYSAVGPNADNLEVLRTMGISDDEDEEEDSDIEEIEEDTENISSSDTTESEAQDSDFSENTEANEENGVESNDIENSGDNDDFFDSLDIDNGQLGFVENINDEISDDDGGEFSGEE